MRIGGLALFLVMGICSFAMAAVLPFPASSLPGKDIGNGLGAGYETSGIVWQSRLQRFFTVDDGGQISSMDAQGNHVTHSQVSGDLEGITVADANSDFVYYAREDANAIIEYDVVKKRPTRGFSLTNWTGPGSNSGLEALTFVSDASDPEGGLFYAGKQGDGVIYAFRLPIASSRTSTTVAFQFSFQPAPGRTDLSGLHYDAANRVLYAIWDSSNLLRAMRPDGTFLAEWRLPPGRNEEGITFQDGNLLIARDTGPDVYRYSNFPQVVPEPSCSSLVFWACLLWGNRFRSQRAADASC